LGSRPLIRGSVPERRLINRFGVGSLGVVSRLNERLCVLGWYRFGPEGGQGFQELPRRDHSAEKQETRIERVSWHNWVDDEGRPP